MEFCNRHKNNLVNDTLRSTQNNFVTNTRKILQILQILQNYFVLFTKVSVLDTKHFL